jgi:hypothetical protein
MAGWRQWWRRRPPPKKQSHREPPNALTACTSKRLTAEALHRRLLRVVVLLAAGLWLVRLHSCADPTTGVPATAASMIAQSTHEKPVSIAASSSQQASGCATGLKTSATP